MNRVLIDTDVLVDFLRGYSAAVDWIESCAERPLVSVITIAELRAGMRAGEEAVLETLINAVEPVLIDPDIAGLGGDFRRQFGPSHGTGLADALIAACAVHARATLATLNIRHYPMLDRVHAPYSKFP